MADAIVDRQASWECYSFLHILTFENSSTALSYDLISEGTGTRNILPWATLRYDTLQRYANNIGRNLILCDNQIVTEIFGLAKRRKS